MSIVNRIADMLRRTAAEGLTPGAFCTSPGASVQIRRELGRSTTWPTLGTLTLLGRPLQTTGVPYRSDSATVDHLIASALLPTRDLVADRIRGGSALDEMRGCVADDVAHQLRKIVAPLVQITADRDTETHRAEARVTVRQFRRGDSVCIQLEFLQDKEAL